MFYFVMSLNKLITFARSQLINIVNIDFLIVLFLLSGQTAHCLFIIVQVYISLMMNWKFSVLSDMMT